MDKFRRYAFPTVVLALVLGLGIGFRLFLLDILIRPSALFLWAIWRVAASVNQSVYWTLLIIACLFLALRLLPPEEPGSGHPADPYRYRRPARLVYWRDLLAAGLSRNEEKEALRDSLRGLLTAIIEETEHLRADDLEELVSSGRLALPPAVKRFLVEEDEAEAMSSLRKLRDWLGNLPGGSRHRDEALLSEVLSWMESRLEMPHDR